MSKYPILQKIRDKVRGEFKSDRPPTRSISVHEGDVFITSYPRSGNTWMRFLLANLRWPGEDLDYASFRDRVPDIYMRNTEWLRDLGDPRWMKSHEQFDPRYPKTVYLVRDPRDVVVSFFQFLRLEGEIPLSSELDEVVPRIVEGEFFPHVTWGEHVRGWLAGKQEGEGDVLLVRYEDLKGDEKGVLQNVATFIGFDADGERIEEACQKSSLENMRELEREFREGKEKGPNFIRKGKVGEGNEELADDQRRIIEERWGDVMDELGYLA